MHSGITAVDSGKEKQHGSNLRDNLHCRCRAICAEIPANRLHVHRLEQTGGGCATYTGSGFHHRSVSVLPGGVEDVVRSVSRGWRFQKQALRFVFIKGKKGEKHVSSVRILRLRSQNALPQGGVPRGHLDLLEMREDVAHRQSRRSAPQHAIKGA